jgi:hypothetical protein
VFDARTAHDMFGTPTAPSPALDAKVTVGVPGVVAVEIPVGGLAQLTWRRFRPRVVSVLPLSGHIALDSFCRGSAVVNVAVIHPASDVCPVGRIDVEHWLFSDGVNLGIQAFFAHVEGRSPRRYTLVPIALALTESHIKIIADTVGDAMLASDAARVAGIPYKQRLHVRLHFRGRNENSELHELTVPNVPVQVHGTVHLIGLRGTHPNAESTP